MSINRKITLHSASGFDAEVGTEPDLERSGAGVRLHFLDLEPDPDLCF